MLDLSSLAPSRFGLDTASYRWNNGWPWQWGLILRKWFEHSGRINLDKISAYIEAHDTFKEELGNFSTKHIDWQITHFECNSDRKSCGYPPEPEGPETPILKDYTTQEDEKCPLSDILRHPYSKRLATTFSVHGPFCSRFSLVYPEQQSSPGTDAEPKFPDGE